jgi:hypothetical protein
VGGCEGSIDVVAAVGDVQRGPTHSHAPRFPPAPPAPGSYCAPLLPLLRDKLLPAFGAGWQAGAVGSPGGSAPSAGEYAAAVAGAPALLFLGVGRFLAHVPPAVSRGSGGGRGAGTRPRGGAGADERQPLPPTPFARPQVLAGADLSGCGAALVLDRSNTEAAAARQLRLDNRKQPAARGLEAPTAAAMLLLLRGTRAAAVTTAATTSWANGQAAGALLRGLAEGQPLGAAAAAARSALEGYEVAAARDAGIVVWGLPHAAAEGGGGGDGARRGKGCGGGGGAAAGAAPAGGKK